jgi:hypothetical protein
MKKVLRAVLMVGCLAALNLGCHSTVEGRLEPGVPFGKDTIVSRYERPYQQVYAAAVAVIRRNGQLTNDDQVTKVLKGRVDNNTVWVKLDDSEPRITRVSVEARTRGGAANVELASELDKQIYGMLVAEQR